MSMIPKLPMDRPPTKAEVWRYINVVYEGQKTREEMIAYGRRCWAMSYVLWVNDAQWQRPPDWTEEHQTVKKDAVPIRPIEGEPTAQLREVERLYAIAYPKAAA